MTEEVTLDVFVTVTDPDKHRRIGAASQYIAREDSTDLYESSTLEDVRIYDFEYDESGVSLSFTASATDDKMREFMSSMLNADKVLTVEKTETGVVV